MRLFRFFRTPEGIFAVREVIPVKYRPEIDGLRAFAVVPVVLFHAGMPGFSGGYVGVDVFFVISGYLITTLLLADLDGDRFSILTFYERRARRILPALFVVLAICVPVALYLLVPWELAEFGKSLVAVVFFASNILFWQEIDYFSGPAEEVPLLHTWSLAVEEQFYLLFPLLLFLLRDRGWRQQLAVFCLFALCSLGLSQWMAGRYPEANFFLAPTRFWELLAGSIAALWIARQGFPRGRAGPVAGAVGLLAIVASVVLFDAETPFPSVYAVIPVLGTVLIVLFATSATSIGRFLAWRPFVGIGLISYSTYLWHQPLFAFTRIAYLSSPPLWVMLWLSVLALALAYLTWAWVEQPFRRPSRRWMPQRRQVFGASLVGSVAFILIGLAIVRVEGLPARYDYLAVGEYDWNNLQLQQQSWASLRKKSGDPGYSTEGNPFDDQLWFVPDGRSKVLLVGNSHAKDLYNALDGADALASRYQFALFVEQVRRFPVAWPRFSQTPNFIEADFILVAPRYSELDVVRLPRFLDLLKDARKPTILVLNTPEFAGDLTKTLVDQMVQDAVDGMIGPAEFAALSQTVNHAHWADAVERPTIEALNAELRAIAQTAGVPVLDRRDYICDDPQQVCFAMRPDLTKHFFDYGHTTEAGAAFFGARIAELGWLDKSIAQLQGR
jgi:peptidoglycan/LPS O-acetylase OafA/YrhL